MKKETKIQKLERRNKNLLLKNRKINKENEELIRKNYYLKEDKQELIRWLVGFIITTMIFFSLMIVQVNHKEKYQDLLYCDGNEYSKVTDQALNLVGYKCCYEQKRGFFNYENNKWINFDDEVCEFHKINGVIIEE